MVMDGLCIVCGKILGEYDNLFDHLIGKDTRMMDSSHSFYEKRVKDSNFRDPCFCGGAIEIFGSHPNNFEASCQKCGFIWAED
jgi:hypothetical protein